MPTALYLKASGHPALRLCDPLVPCPAIGGYDPATLDWSDVAPGLFDGDNESTTLDALTWLDDANVWQEITPEPPLPPRQSGDDVLRFKKPIVTIRPKVEVELEEALETLETVRPSDRVAANKAKVRTALQTVKAIEAPPSYANAIANIEANLKAVSRATAKHEGMMDALLTVAMEIQGLIAEMQRKRAEQRKRNMEKLLWLL